MTTSPARFQGSDEERLQPFRDVRDAIEAQFRAWLAAIAIGGTVALDALWGGPISGASMNPARSFGPALVSDIWQDHWVYWIGPLLGTCLGGLVYQSMRAPVCITQLSQS